MLHHLAKWVLGILLYFKGYVLLYMLIPDVLVIFANMLIYHYMILLIMSVSIKCCQGGAPWSPNGQSHIA